MRDVLHQRAWQDLGSRGRERVFGQGRTWKVNWLLAARHCALLSLSSCLVAASWFVLASVARSAAVRRVLSDASACLSALCCTQASSIWNLSAAFSSLSRLRSSCSAAHHPLGLITQVMEFKVQNLTLGFDTYISGLYKPDYAHFYRYMAV